MEGKRKIDLAKILNLENAFCTIYCERDSKFENNEKIIFKQARIEIEIDTDMKMSINDAVVESNEYYLNDRDNVQIQNLSEENIIKFQYNNL